MLLPQIKIDVGGTVFDFVTEFESQSSWEMLTDTAFIIIPNKFRFKGKTLTQGADGIFKRGDKVTIQAFYVQQNKTIKTIYQGIVASIIPDGPLQLNCEDEMWLLKQNSITISTRQQPLKDFIQTVLTAAGNAAEEPIKSKIQAIKFEADVQTTIGKFRITNTSAAKVFEELRSKYGLLTFFRDGVLIVGLAVNLKKGVEHKFKFQSNISRSRLEFQNKDDLKIKVVAQSFITNNKKIEVTVGDPGGEQITLPFSGLNEAQLKVIAQQELDRINYTGFRGDFETLGEPSVNHGDIAVIEDPKFGSDRDGKYLIKSVLKRFDTAVGYKQIIELDQKVSA